MCTGGHMKFYNITDQYISHLKELDNKVPDNKGGKRPYVGIVLEVESSKYFAPFTSPKPKHQTMRNSKDFRKINGGLYGGINFNNMIPVVDSALIMMDIPNIQDAQYQRLLQNQYSSIRSDKKQIESTALRLRNLIFTEDENLSPFDLTIKQRCCNLPVLEEAANNYQFNV